MYQIGSGLQYNVYDIGGGRVRKTPTSLIEKLRTLHSWGGKYDFFRHPVYDIRFAFGTVRTMRKSIGGLQEHYQQVDLSLLGNPVLLDGYGYEQDKVAVLGEVFENAPASKKHTLIDSYFAQMQACWTYGFSDSVFNFTINNGVTESGDVILIDLGEITWDKEHVREKIEKRKLLHQSSFKSIDDESLRSYITQKWDSEITEENLSRLWGSALLSVQ